MTTTIYEKLSSLVKENEQTNAKVTLNNYDIKCNNKGIYSFDYEMTVDEESMLDFIYNADNLGFGDEVGVLMQQKISLDAQKSFFTKLFIYEKLSELEKDYSFSYTEYVPKLNTGAYDKEPKSAEQLLETYGASCLKTDKDFRKTVKTFKEMEVVIESNKSDDTAIRRHK